MQGTFYDTREACQFVMGRLFAIIVVDNDSKKIIGRVTEYHGFGFGINLEDTKHVATGVYDLMDKAKKNNASLYYRLGGVRIPFNYETHKRQIYLSRVGWWNITPAESVIFSFLYQERYKENGWVSTDRLEEMLTIFGFTPHCLRILILHLRKKLEFTNFDVENQNRVGYRLVNSSDYWILFTDSKFQHVIEGNIEYLTISERLTGEHILRGWQGLTRTEAQIFFELVKYRGEWVSYDHLLRLPWAVKKQKKKDLLVHSLRDFVSNIRWKIADTDEEILTKYRKGYSLV